MENGEEREGKGECRTGFDLLETDVVDGFITVLKRQAKPSQAFGKSSGSPPRYFTSTVFFNHVSNAKRIQTSTLKIVRQPHLKKRKEKANPDKHLKN